MAVRKGDDGHAAPVGGLRKALHEPPAGSGRQVLQPVVDQVVGTGVYDPDGGRAGDGRQQQSQRRQPAERERPMGDDRFGGAQLGEHGQRRCRRVAAAVVREVVDEAGAQGPELGVGGEQLGELANGHGEPAARHRRVVVDHQHGRPPPGAANHPKAHQAS